MSEECVKRMAHFGFELPARRADDRGEQEKLSRILEQAYNQYEQTKDVLWCCLDSGEGGSVTERLSSKDAFYAVTTELHGLLVQCAQLYRHAAERGRRLEDELGRERALRLGAENRAALREKDGEAERRLREAREALDREAAEAEKCLRSERARADQLELKLRATEKELLVLRALRAAGAVQGIPGTTLTPHLNAAGTLGVGNGIGVSSGVTGASPGRSVPSGGGLSGFQLGNVSDYVFGAPGGDIQPQTAAWTALGPPDGDLVARRAVFKKEVLQDAVNRLQTEKSSLEAQIVTYGRLLSAAQSHLHSAGLDPSEVEKLISHSAEWKGRSEVEQLQSRIVQLQEQVNQERRMREEELLGYQNEKLRLRKEWEVIYNNICDELGVVPQRLD